MKVLVVGSRSFNNYEMLKHTLDDMLENKTNIEVVSGGANGTDKLAERYAKEKGFGIKVFLANWNCYGRSAGYKRNIEMHKYIAQFDERLCVAFWDGVSKGTQHSFKLAEQFSNPIKVIRISK